MVHPLVTVFIAANMDSDTCAKSLERHNAFWCIESTFEHASTNSVSSTFGIAMSQSIPKSELQCLIIGMPMLQYTTPLSIGVGFRVGGSIDGRFIWLQDCCSHMVISIH